MAMLTFNFIKSRQNYSGLSERAVSQLLIKERKEIYRDYIGHTDIFINKINFLGFTRRSLFSHLMSDKCTVENFIELLEQDFDAVIRAMDCNDFRHVHKGSLERGDIKLCFLWQQFLFFYETHGKRGKTSFREKLWALSVSRYLSISNSVFLCEIRSRINLAVWPIILWCAYSYIALQLAFDSTYFIS